MTCDACQAAEANPRTGRYRADCRECAARLLANGPEHFEAKRVGKLTPAYREALARVFGADGWMDGHNRVKAWASRRDSA